MIKKNSSWAMFYQEIWAENCFMHGRLFPPRKGGPCDPRLQASCMSNFTASLPQAAHPHTCTSHKVHSASRNAPPHGLSLVPGMCKWTNLRQKAQNQAVINFRIRLKRGAVLACTRRSDLWRPEDGVSAAYWVSSPPVASLLSDHPADYRLTTIISQSCCIPA